MIAGLTVVEFLRVFVLIGVGVALLYPVAAYAPRVMHTNAIFVLTATLAVLAISVVVQAFQGRSVVSEGLQVAASGGYLWSVWLFAREYVHGGSPPDLNVELTTTQEGFEDARRD
ncbi:hypothetical protein HUG10_03795 [Halorarum halophilum]|uniref:Uncharacterized protein n=1 Tax=Halorarum halophilum TaxID=2743090 RepID=A0A7D5KWI8_9EURY|nr:hypothetical protein [Halobaculum halophilum]QLG26718.1 hypothetical protein HUG10_03795 [Halobaculum halophilum]